jgi:hypothetical protein
MKHTQPITHLHTVVECLFGSALFGVEVKKVVLAEVYRKFIFNEHQNTFASWRVLKAIDLSPVGGLNYNGIETLQTVENLGKHERGILPARTSIQRASLDLFNFGQELIPFHRKESYLGEVYQYEFEKFFRHILKPFGLETITQMDAVEVSITLDGAELCDGLCHLTAGIKVTDPRAVDPNYCFAMKSLLGKDSKETYKEFADFFSFFERVMKEGLPASELGPRIMCVTVLSPQDLSSIWKRLGTGSGARKNGNTHFCHVCPCTGNSIASFKVGANR